MSDEPTKIILGDTALSMIEQSPRARRFFRRKKQPPPKLHCENCGAELRGHWCSQCGQPAVDYHRSFQHVIWDVLDALLNWDSKFFASIGLLVAKPWRLTNDFVAGKRVRYFHPLRLYLLASILFFFAATYGIKSSHINTISLSPGQRTAIENILQQHNIAPDTRTEFEKALVGKPVSSLRRAELERELADDDVPQIARDAIRDRLEHGELPPDARKKIEAAMTKLPPDARAEVQAALQKSTGNSGPIIQTDEESPNSLGKKLERRAREKFGEGGTNVQLVLLALMSNLPYMMFVCVPLFALVLKLLYLRQHIFYINHLIYALHIHSFAYLGIMATVLATIGLNHLSIGPLAGLIIAALWILFSLQIFLSIRKVYCQSWFMSIFKFLLGGFIYLIVLFSALLTTFIITIALP